MRVGMILCRVGIHTGGHTVSGWREDGALMMAWRCARCHALKHLHPTGTRIPPANVAAVRQLALDIGDNYNIYVSPAGSIEAAPGEDE